MGETLWEIWLLANLLSELNIPYADVEESKAKYALCSIFTSIISHVMRPCGKSNLLSNVFGIWSCTSKVNTLRFLVYSWGFYFIYTQRGTMEKRPELYSVCVTGTVATMICFALEIYKIIGMPTQILRTYLDRKKVERESKAIVRDKSYENNEQIQFKKECGDQETEESKPKRVQYFENWKKIAYFLEVLIIFFTVPALWSTCIQRFFKYDLVFGFLRMATFWVSVGAFLIDFGANFIDQIFSLMLFCARQLPDNYPDSILNRGESL